MFVRVCTLGIQDVFSVFCLSGWEFSLCACVSKLTVSMCTSGVQDVFSELRDVDGSFPCCVAKLWLIMESVYFRHT